MRIFPGKYRLIGWLSIVLVVGFLTTSIVGYVVSRDVIRKGIETETLPLTGDNIYSEIQKDILRPVFISSLMAHDTFVRDWILGGEQDSAQIARYLKEVKQKYGTISSFLVSDRSRKYYIGDGVLKAVDQNEPRDVWYFRVRAMQQAYETNVDFDMANRDTMTIFINYRVLDYQGNFIGATGVGLTLDTMARLIDSYQKRFHRSIYFVDEAGKLVLAGKTRAQAGSIRETPGIMQVAGAILNRNATPASNQYTLDRETVLVNSRYLPELGWYLVVEQNVTEEIMPVQRAFVLNLVISAAVTLLVLLLAALATNHYQGRLERVAATDALTGLLNRQAFEFVFRQAIAETARSKRPLSAILFDLDWFKQINDMQGHLCGDSVLRTVAELARKTVRSSDVVARWGGEEFLVLLKGCTLEEARGRAERLREAVQAHPFPELSGKPVTISAGVAQYAEDESESEFFGRVDTALYAAKDGGRNRVETSVPDAQEESAQRPRR